jgi:predicted dinucleotide-binding enzyme
VNIAIIGAGNVGGTLVRRFTTLGHQVRVANSRGPQTLADLQTQTGVRPVRLKEIAAGANALFVAIPLGGIPTPARGGAGRYAARRRRRRHQQLCAPPAPPGSTY